MTTNSAELKREFESWRSDFMRKHCGISVTPFDAYQAGRTAAQGDQSKADEQQCGCCGGTGRMVRDPDIGTDQECFACDGTGRCEDDQAGSAEQVSEREHLLRELKWCIDEGHSGPRTHVALIRAYAALSAPERKVTDAEIVKAVHAACGTGRVALTCTNNDGDEIPTDVARCFAKSILNQQGEQTAPEGWLSVEDRLPDAPLFIVRSTRDDLNATDGIQQFDGMWVVRPTTNVSKQRMSNWLAFHKVTHWMPLPAAPSTAQKDGHEN